MACQQIDPSEDPRRPDSPAEADQGPPLSREDVLAMDDRPTVAVVIPEWGGRSILVRTISALERDSWDLYLVANADPETHRLRPAAIRATLVSLCACDVEGNRLFTDQDVEFLARKSAAAIDRIYEAARRLNKVSDADVEELKKTSAATATSSSQPPLPWPGATAAPQRFSAS